MVNKEILMELKDVISRRGELTKVQREYARIEERLISEMYPVIKPAEERRPPNSRTLESYIGKQAVQTIMMRHESSLS